VANEFSLGLPPICPRTGRARLGYDRARVLFKKHTATATSGGLELHHLRHFVPAATHLGDQKDPLQLIMAKIRHKSARAAWRRGSRRSRCTCRPG
jgi:hypothetical protein